MIDALDQESSLGRGYDNGRSHAFILDRVMARDRTMGDDTHDASVRRAGMVVAMIPQLGDHFHPGPDGFNERRVHYNRSILYGNHHEIVMQAARTRQPHMGDALAFVVLANHRATSECVYSLLTEWNHRHEWPILRIAMLYELDEIHVGVSR